MTIKWTCTMQYHATPCNAMQNTTHFFGVHWSSSYQAKDATYVAELPSLPRLSCVQFLPANSIEDGRCSELQNFGIELLKPWAHGHLRRADRSRDQAVESDVDLAQTHVLLMLSHAATGLLGTHQAFFEHERPHLVEVGVLGSLNGSSERR